MTPLPPVPNVLQITHTWTDGADANAIVRHHAKWTGSPLDPATGIDMANSIMTTFSGADNLASSSFYDSVNIVDLTAGATLNATSTNSPVAGGLAGTPIGGGSAVLCNYEGVWRYRGGKPRSYYPFGDSSSVLTQQTWTTDFIGDVQTQVEALRLLYAALSIGGCTLAGQVAVSYYSGVTGVPYPTNPDRTRNVPTKRVTPLIYEILTVTANDKIASQRRRNLRR